ncbi:MAG TPA: DUF6249 domain-containing protein [Hyphomicrobiales bacterium]|nr:DUF6249 domain-containing protein [Hyphomicrobiales bacterium]
MEGLGAGLASLAFWGFVAACVVSGVWDGVRKRETQHETLRRLIESGKPIDSELLDKILGEPPRWRGLHTGGIIMLSIGVGFAVLSAFQPRILLPLLGVSGLVCCLGLGLLIASHYAKRWHERSVGASTHLPKE